MKIFALCILFLTAVACSSVQKTEPERPYSSVEIPQASSNASKTSAREEELDENVDEFAIQKWLGMERSPLKLGYKEKSFNTCRAGYGYSQNKNCRQKHMVVIHYRLQCRESEGTVSRALTASDIRDIASTNVKWSLRNKEGISRTDSEGYGQIRAIFSGSQKSQRLRLGVDGELLYVRAGELTSIVTPGSWCKF